jgi:hypothetical protein
MEEINLSDLGFNFEDYFQRWQRGDLSAEEQVEFDARVIGIFCRRVLLSSQVDGAWTEWESFAAYWLAKKLEQVIGGVPWRKSFDLPYEWGKHESDFSDKGARAVEIFCAVYNTRKDSPDSAVTHLIEEQAYKHCISYETARDDYYRVKKAIDDGLGFSPFLKTD